MISSWVKLKEPLFIKYLKIRLILINLLENVSFQTNVTRIIYVHIMYDDSDINCLVFVCTDKRLRVQ